MSARVVRSNTSDGPDSLFVYRLHDAWTTLQLALLARQHSGVVEFLEANADTLVEACCVVTQTCPPSTPSPTSPSHVVTSTPVVEALPPSWARLGGSVHTTPHCVYLVLPTYTALFYDYTMASAMLANAEMSRQYAGRCLIAKLQTVGGGWASLHRADRALLCALQLYAIAEAVFDEEVVRKCRIFIGWAHLWNSDPAKALTVFRAELADARARGDTVHERRCLHAICNAERNPKLAPGGAYTDHYDLVDCWSRAFA